MIKRFLFVLLIAFSSLANQGCTYRAWYEGFQETQRQECYKSSSQGEIQECLDRVNSVTYDEYKRSREGE